MCGKSSVDSIKHFRTVASYFSASPRWAPSAPNNSVSYLKTKKRKKEHQDTALHMIERVKCLRALCRNHQRRKHPFFRRKSRGAQRIKIKNGKIDTHTIHMYTSMKGNYYATKWKIYFAAHIPLLDQDILFKRYVTETQISWPLFRWKKKCQRHSGNQKKKGKSKTMENVANAAGRVRHGSPTRFSFFFFAPVSHARIW